MFIGDSEVSWWEKIYYMLKTYIEELQYISKNESVKKYFDAQLETNQGSLEIWCFPFHYWLENAHKFYAHNWTKKLTIELYLSYLCLK